MLLFYDTETTGLTNEFGPLESQPQLVQLACLLYTPEGLEVASASLIISPEGAYEIPAQAAHVHGISTALAHERGVSLQCATRVFAEFQNVAQVEVAHNWKFDDLVMRAALKRAWPKRDAVRPLGFCTMEAASPILNLPPTPAMVRAGRNHPKPPRLVECIKFFFNEELLGAHDALVDVRACARVYFHLKQQGHA